MAALVGVRCSRAIMTFDLRPVGRTALKVTSVGFGCASIGNLGQAFSDAECAAVLERAWEAGIRHFDTAPHYGRGLSETRLGVFLRGKPRGEIAVSTKVGRVLSPGAQVESADGFFNPLPNDARYGYSAEAIEEALAGSLARLGTEHIDIVYIHDIGTKTHGSKNARHYEDLVVSGLPYLQRLKAAGRIGAIGIGVNETAIAVQMLMAGPLDVILLAGRWTLLDREAETQLVPLAREKGTSLILGGIYNSGILALGAKPGAWFNYQPAGEAVLARVRELESEAAKVGVSLPQAALQFGLTRPGVASVLLGTASVAQLEHNLALAESPLSTVAADRLFA
jgi:D-threo-aldose 1-dehydrogenase